MKYEVQSMIAIQKMMIAIQKMMIAIQKIRSTDYWISIYGSSIAPNLNIRVRLIKSYYFSLRPI